MSLRRLDRAAEPRALSLTSSYLTRPRLLLRPLAFLKLTYLCQAAGTEVGGFGLSSEHDPLVIEDLLVPKQECTAVTVAFDDEAVADLVEDLAEQGVPPARMARVWVHTHPGTSASPSGTDEQTFARCFGGADFAVMLILARGGAFYARLQLNGPVPVAVDLPVGVDWPGLPEALDEQADALPGLIRSWAEELAAKVVQPTEQAFDGLLVGEDELPHEVCRGYWWEEELLLSGLEAADALDREREVGLEHDLT